MWSHPSRRFLPALTGVCVAAGWLWWPQAAGSHETLTTTVLFDREIVRILNQHCVMCHVETGPSFPLATYDQTWVQARKIRLEVIARHMPPWSAFPGYGEFLNDNSLTLREVQFMNSWVEGSGPRDAGRVFTNIADPRAPRRQEIRAEADFGHWRLGEPDWKRALPPRTIGPKQGDFTERVVVDTGLTSERLVRGLEYMPGDRRVVRSAVFTVQETGQWVGSWTPWYGFMSLPKGAAWRVPAGAHIAADIQYHGTQQPVVDQGTLGLFFADTATTDFVSDLVLESKGDMPLGAVRQKFRAAVRLPAMTYLVALQPQYFPGVESLEISARKPDETTVTMLFVKNIRLDWPTPYLFKNPIALPAGSELFATAYYTNPGASPKRAGIRVTFSRYQQAGRGIPKTGATSKR